MNKKNAYLLKIGKRSFDFSKEKAVMAIINATPDSFYDGGKVSSPASIEKKIQQCLKEGADILDIGGESTKPGAGAVSSDEQLKRIIPVFEVARSLAPKIPISIDTYSSTVAKKMLSLGADMINDISGFSFDKKMADTVAKYGASVVLMHIKGNPGNMQKNPQYKELIKEISVFLQRALFNAVQAGITDIVIDPGIGFGKTMEHNYEIIDRLEEFSILERPLLIGISRKSLIGKALDRPVEERLPATMALNLVALQKGASIIRVHDVREGKEAIILYEKLMANRK